jgi:hypothetical protein
MATLHGNTARVYMARQWIANCFDNRKAAKYINEQSPGDYRDALIAEAKRFHMVEDAKKKGRVKAVPKKGK